MSVAEGIFLPTHLDPVSPALFLFSVRISILRVPVSAAYLPYHLHKVYSNLARKFGGEITIDSLFFGLRVSCVLQDISCRIVVGFNNSRRK